MSTRRLSKAVKVEMSLILLLEISKNVRFGRLTKFSILEMSLFCRFKYLIFSSPSNNGMCFRFLLSSVIFSTFISLSLGLLYTITMFGIWGSYTYRVNVSCSMFWILPCLSKYLYLSSFSSFNSLRIMLGSGLINFTHLTVGFMLAEFWVLAAMFLWDRNGEYLFSTELALTNWSLF